jgi:hypothetical protein
VIAFIDEARRERLRRAVMADAELRRVAAGDGALALALGETLREIFEADLLGKLCFTREKETMRERLGLPPRTGYQFLRLAKETRGKDLLRRAVLCGAITISRHWHPEQGAGHRTGLLAGDGERVGGAGDGGPARRTGEAGEGVRRRAGS